MSIVVVSPDFRVPIPDEVRRELPLLVGDTLEVKIQDGAIVLYPKPDERRASLDRVMEALREPLPPDDEFFGLSDDEIMEKVIGLLKEGK